MTEEPRTEQQPRAKVPKIRDIKPEFFTDEKVCRLSIPARYVFIGLWGWCCNEGHVLATPWELKVRLVPTDDVDIDELLSEAAKVGLIERHDDQVKVPNFRKHQKIDKRWNPVCEVCSAEARRSSVEPLRNSAEEKGVGEGVGDMGVGVGTREVRGLTDDDPDDYFARRKALHLSDRSQGKAHDMRHKGRPSRDIAIAVNRIHKDYADESRTERWYDGSAEYDPHTEWMRS
jgi:hypothetical protein